MKKIKENTDLMQKIEYFFPIIVLLAICAIFSVLTGGKFTSFRNLNLIITQALVIGTVATGAVLIFSSGNMNIAMGGATAIASIIGGNMYLKTGSPAAMMLGCIIGGIIIMGLCCILSKVFKVPIVIITIILMTLFTSLQELLVGRNNLKLDYMSMKALSDANIPLMICIVFFLICFILFEFTSFGRNLKFIGENKACARQTGMNEMRIVSIAFLVSGIGIGFGAFSTLVRAATVTQTTCASLNMDVMLAIVLAGTPLTGGSRSKIFSGILGAVMITALNSGLLMVGVDSIYIQAVRGVFFVIMIALSEKKSELLS